MYINLFRYPLYVYIFVYRYHIIIIIVGFCRTFKNGWTNKNNTLNDGESLTSFYLLILTTMQTTRFRNNMVKAKPYNMYR